MHGSAKPREAEAAFTLPLTPGMKMVGGVYGLKTGLLSHGRPFQQLAALELLLRGMKSDKCHIP
jgi:hypothetical protein